MSRSSMFVLCGALAFSGATGALAMQNWNVLAEEKTTEGSIKSVDLAANSFVISTGIGNDKKDVTVKINSSTKYTLDGKESTKDKALVAGNTAKVKHTDGVAASVEAKSPKKPA
jgi:hypothetical protein